MNRWRKSDKTKQTSSGEMINYMFKKRKKKKKSIDLRIWG